MKKLLFVFSIIVLLAAGCNSSKQASNETRTAQNKNQALTATAKIDTSNWKTYNNPLGFSVKVPPDYIYVTEADNSMDFNSPDGNVAVHIDGINNPQKLDLQTFYSNFDETFSNGPDSPYATSTAQSLVTNINGYQELKFPDLAKDPSNFPSDFTASEKLALTPSEQISVNLGQLVVELISTNSTKPDEANPITDVMANSVNVAPITIPTSTEQKSQNEIPSGWQVYTNNKFNYQIAYPSNLKTGEYCMGGEMEHVPVLSDDEFSCDLNIVSGKSDDYMIMVVNGFNVNGNYSIPGTDFTSTMRLGEARPDYALQDITKNLTKVGYQQLVSTTLDGIPVVRFNYNSKLYGSHDFWYFVKDDFLYFIELTPSEHKDDLRLQILNTLKFF